MRPGVSHGVILSCPDRRQQRVAERRVAGSLRVQFTARERWREYERRGGADRVQRGGGGTPGLAVGRGLGDREREVLLGCITARACPGLRSTPSNL